MLKVSPVAQRSAWCRRQMLSVLNGDPHNMTRVSSMVSARYAESIWTGIVQTMIKVSLVMLRNMHSKYPQ